MMTNIRKEDTFIFLLIVILIGLQMQIIERCDSFLLSSVPRLRSPHKDNKLCYLPSSNSFSFFSSSSSSSCLKFSNLYDDEGAFDSPISSTSLHFRNRIGYVSKLKSKSKRKIRPIGREGNEGSDIFKQYLFGKTPFEPNNDDDEQGNEEGDNSKNPISRPYDSSQSIELFKKFMEGSSLSKSGDYVDLDGNFQQPSLQLISGNDYIDIITSISPNDLISRFQYTAPERVKDAVKKTTLGFVGSISNYVVDQVYTSYGVALASLLLQCQITGYMFRNAEAKLAKNYGPDERQLEDRNQRKMLPEDITTKEKKKGQTDLKNLPLPPLASDNIEIYDNSDQLPPLSSTISSSTPTTLNKGNQIARAEDQFNLVGKITVKDETTGELIEVDAEEYIKGLKEEANKLKQQLNQFEIEKKEKITKDLFNYLKTLPQNQLKDLTANMGTDVVEAMQKLVQDVMKKVDETPIEENHEKEIGGASLAQLVMWGLVVGYNLRDIEMTWENGLPNDSSYRNKKKK